MNASALIIVDTGVFVENFDLDTVGNGQDASQFFTVSSPINADVRVFGDAVTYSSSQTILSYGDPGTTPGCAVIYNHKTSLDDLFCTISGYLVDLP